MGAAVRIDSTAWSDLRFVTLARLMRYADSDHALAKCSRLWSWQTENYTPESPTYVVDEDTIESALGHGGAQALVRSRLAETTPDGFRVKGSKGRIEWLHQRRIASSKGGEAKKRNLQNKDKPSGTSPGISAGGPEQLPTQEPEQSPLTPTLDLKDHSLPRAIPPTAVPSTNHQESAWERKRRWWDAMLKADARIKASGIEPNAPPLPSGFAGENEKNLHACERQLVDAGYTSDQVNSKMLHIVLVAEAEAMREGNRNWFKPAMIWDPKRANRAVDTTLEEARSKRDPPRTSQPRNDLQPPMNTRIL